MNAKFYRKTQNKCADDLQKLQNTCPFIAKLIIYEHLNFVHYWGVHYWKKITLFCSNWNRNHELTTHYSRAPMKG